MMSLYLSMAAFALAASISPGPVNLVSLSAGARHGLRVAMRHVAGATLGFTLLLVLIGLGLHQLLVLLPWLTAAIQWAGVAFLLYLAWRLAVDNGALQGAEGGAVASFTGGALMQWLNPKAWLAAIAGMGAFAADGDAVLVGQFAAIYCVVCYLSLACWAIAGTWLQPYLQAPQRVRVFNRVLAGLLVVSAGVKRGQIFLWCSGTGLKMNPPLIPIPLPDQPESRQARGAAPRPPIEMTSK